MSQADNTTINFIVSLFNSYGIIPTFIALVIIIGIYQKLRNDVDNLKRDLERMKKEFDEHPAISLFKQWINKKGHMSFIMIF